MIKNVHCVLFACFCQEPLVFLGKPFYCFYLTNKKKLFILLFSTIHLQQLNPVEKDTKGQAFRNLPIQLWFQ
jgi:hypothetical protein